MLPSRPTPSTASSSKTITSASYPTIGIHRGAIDQTTITTGAPPEVMKHVLGALETMGVIVEAEHEYRYRCTRPRRPSSFDFGGLDNHQNGKETDTEAVMSTSARVNCSDPPEEAFEKSFTAELASDPYLDGAIVPPTPVQSSIMLDPSPSTSTPPALPPSPVPPAMPHTLPVLSLPHRPSQPIPPASVPTHVPPNPIIIAEKPPHLQGDPASTASSSDSDFGVLHSPVDARHVSYGPRTEDPGEEVRFTVELTRLDLLEDTYSLDIRRLKGNLRSYKFVYDTLREHVILPLLLVKC